MQQIEFTSTLPHVDAPPPRWSRIALIQGLALAGSMLANNAGADDIISVCRQPDAPQSPRDSIPPIERAS